MSTLSTSESSSEDSFVDTEDFQEVKSSKSKRRHHSPAGEIPHEKKMKPATADSPRVVDNSRPKLSLKSPVAGTSGQPSNANPYSDCIVFVKGVNSNIGRYALQNPIIVKRTITAAIGDVRSIKVKDDHIIITCQNPTQKITALQLSDIHGQSVKVSPPGSNNRKPQNPSGEKLSKGIIFGVPLSLTDEDIIEETTSSSVRRLTKFINGKRENTETVVLTFTQLPERVNIGFRSYRVKPYIPLPFRCTNCQKFGHSHNSCNKGVVCPRCSGNHTFAECTQKDNPKCSNCNGDHSAAWSGCPKYVQIKQSLKVSVTEKISFRDALLRTKSSVPQSGKPLPVSGTKKPENSAPSTSPVVNQVASKAATSLKTPKPTPSRPEKKTPQSGRQSDSINSIEDKLTKLTDLLKYCIVGILFTLDSASQVSDEESDVTHGLNEYKKTLSLYAASCGIDVADIYQSP